MINQSWTGIRKQKTRRSIRLQTYDYASTGMYFFTICTHNRAPLFGCVTDAQMQLNDFGNVVWDEWNNSAAIRVEVALDTFTVIPNHVHGVVMLQNSGRVEATGRSRADLPRGR
jgi:REP element-mobilizing transposase RayT